MNKFFINRKINYKNIKGTNYELFYEDYSKHTLSQTFSFEKLTGMYISKVEGLSNTQWNIATTTNPFIDGDVINNRVSAPREITFTFRFDLTVPIQSAIELLFSGLAQYGILSSSVDSKNTDLCLMWTKDNENWKYFDCIITNIDLPRYEQTPELTITFYGGPYWYGKDETIEGNIDERYPERFVFDVSSLKGHISTPFRFRYYIDGTGIVDTHSYIFQTIDRGSLDGEDENTVNFLAFLSINHQFPKLENAQNTGFVYNSEKGNKSLYHFLFAEDNNIYQQNRINDVYAGSFFSLMPATKKQQIVVKITRSAAGSEYFIDQSSFNPKGTLIYTPLYI